MMELLMEMWRVRQAEIQRKMKLIKNLIMMPMKRHPITLKLRTNNLNNLNKDKMVNSRSKNRQLEPRKGIKF